MPAERSIAPSTFVLVCGVLIALTFLTVGISFVEMPGTGHVAAGLLIAFSKAILVGLFFMHLVRSPRLMGLVALVSLFWLGILLVLTLNDYFTGGLIPYTPGH